MNERGAKSITLMQFIFIIHGAQIGTGIMSLPRLLAEKAGTDGWLALLIGWVANVAISLLIVHTFKRYPQDTLYDLLRRLFGKWLGSIAFVPVLAYFVVSPWVIQVSAMQYIKAWFLPQTPDYAVMFLYAVPTFMIVKNGLRILGRYCELVTYMTAWMPFILLLVLKDSNWLHLLPVLKEGISPVIRALPPTAYSIIGFEVTFFIYPYLKNKESAALGIVAANSLTLLAYLFVTIVCFVFFSPDEIAGYNQPLLSLLKVIEFRFLERFDLIFLALYLFVVTKSWITYMYCGVIGTSQLLGRHDLRPALLAFVLTFILFVALLHPSWNQTNLMQIWVGNYGLGVGYLVPLLLWLCVQVHARLRRRGGR